MILLRFAAALAVLGCALAAVFFFVRATIYGYRATGERKNLSRDPFGDWNPFNYTDEGWRAVGKAYADMVCFAILLAASLAIGSLLGWVHSGTHW